MTDIADLYPGFATHVLEIDGLNFFARVGGRGHAVLLVRGLWVLDNRRGAPYRLDRSDLRLAARETSGGRWNPAAAFASLADHLRWAQQR